MEDLAACLDTTMNTAAPARAGVQYPSAIAVIVVDGGCLLQCPRIHYRTGNTVDDINPASPIIRNLP